MCGIAGLVLAPGAPGADPATVAALTRALAHRGPDGTGHAVMGRVALIQTRLAIIDLAGGDQPLFAGSAALVANGEIYNYRELRADLPGVRFATASDCELPLHLYLRDGGADYARKLRGMYAIAVHDRAARTVTLSRDPFGIKPLYLAHTDSGLAFASEPQALLAAGLVARQVHQPARDELLQLQFTTGAAHDFPGIERVLPGETWCVRRGGCWNAAASPRCPRAVPTRSRKTRRWRGWTRRWPRVSICTSAATCRTGCFSPAASTAPRSWP